jgi:phosphoribosylglycinamide formyltransferase-1
MRLGFLASRSGSGMRAIVAAIDAGTLAAVPAVVIGNNGDAAALTFARNRDIPSFHVSAKVCGDETLADAAIAETLARHGVELVILSGYMRKLGPRTLQAFRNRVLNIHPALLPRHGGQGMYGARVHAAVVAAGEQESGATIHLVDELYDHGAILAQARVPVLPGDTAADVEARVRAIEPELYVATLAGILDGRIALPA